MGKWEKIEQFLNDLLQKFQSLIGSKASQVTPEKIKSTITNSKKAVAENTGKLIETAKNSKSIAKEKVEKAKEKTLVAIAHTKEKSAEIAVEAKQGGIKNFPWAKIGIALFGFMTPALHKFHLWAASLKKTTVITAITLSTVGSLTGVSIYKNSKELAEDVANDPEMSEQVEKLEKANAYSNRPGYYKRHEKTFTVTNVILPVYYEVGTTRGPASSTKKSNLRKLTIDFTFESSNKYIKKYMWSNPHLIMDKLNSTIEPIAIDFPLEDEGKIIIKEKLKKEVNNLLKDLKIKGEIDKIYINSIIGA